MRLPGGWRAVRTPGYGEAHNIEHACGWRSSLPYDLITQEYSVRRLVANHECAPESGDTDAGTGHGDYEWRSGH